MNKRFVRQSLEEYALRHMPPRPDLWPAIRGQVQPTAPAPRHAISTWGRVAFPTVLLLALVGLAWELGMGPFRNGPGVRSDPGVIGGNSSGLPPGTAATPITKTLEGYTIKMQPLWADANRITLRYTVISPQGTDASVTHSIPNDPNGVPQNPRLTDDQGTEFPWLATRSRFDFDTENNSTPDTSRSVVQWLSVDFDASSLSGSPSQLNLHLTLNPLILAPATPTGARVVHQVTAVTFDFSMPFDGTRRVVDIGQTALVAGVGMVLERVVVSRYETRAILRVLPPAQGTVRRATLAGPDWTARPPTRTRNPTIVECFQLPEGRQACSFYMALLDTQGEWTLNVQGLNGKPSERTTGTWKFRFTVPPAPNNPAK